MNSESPRDQLVRMGREGSTLMNLWRASQEGEFLSGASCRGHRRRWATVSPYNDIGHSTSKHKCKRTRKWGTLKWEVFLCGDLCTYYVCSRVMAKASLQLIQLWSQLHGLLLYLQNAYKPTLQNDRGIPQNVSYLLPHSDDQHQKVNWRASASTSVHKAAVFSEVARWFKCSGQT